MDKIVILSNDIVPGMGLPVAAPGLRAFGLYDGLKKHGFDAKILVPKNLVKSQWKNWSNRGISPTAPDTIILPPQKIQSYIRNNKPVVVVLINSNLVEFVQPSTNSKYVLDIFAPKMLELLYQQAGAYPREELLNLKERKLKALQLADAIIVNGEKKVPYVHGWLMQLEKDVRSMPLEVVNMPMLSSVRDTKTTDKIKMIIAGYLQPWMDLKGWLGVIEKQLGRNDVELNILMPQHWGMKDKNDENINSLEKITANKNVVSHPMMLFHQFQKLVAGMDLCIDLANYTLEREYAMVTRAVCALSCGIPIIHPPFTEVSRLVDAYDAGWLVDPNDLTQLQDVLSNILDAPTILHEKSQNAKNLAQDVFEPKKAVEPLVKIIRDLSSTVS